MAGSEVATWFEADNLCKASRARLISLDSHSDDIIIKKYSKTTLLIPSRVCSKNAYYLKKKRAVCEPKCRKTDCTSGPGIIRPTGTPPSQVRHFQARPSVLMSIAYGMQPFSSLIDDLLTELTCFGLDVAPGRPVSSSLGLCLSFRPFICEASIDQGCYVTTKKEMLAVDDLTMTLLLYRSDRKSPLDGGRALWPWPSPAPTRWYLNTSLWCRFISLILSFYKVNILKLSGGILAGIIIGLLLWIALGRRT